MQTYNVASLIGRIQAYNRKFGTVLIECFYMKLDWQSQYTQLYSHGPWLSVHFNFCEFLKCASIRLARKFLLMQYLLSLLPRQKMHARLHFNGELLAGHKYQEYFLDHCWQSSFPTVIHIFFQFHLEEYKFNIDLSVTIKDAK